MRKSSIMIAALVMVVAALVWLNCTAEKGPEPDAVYPMANQRTEWQYAGK